MQTPKGKIAHEALPLLFLNMATSLSDLKRKGYRLQRSASNGAAITLVSRVGEFSAMFECAAKCAEVLGDRALEDVGDGLLEYIPQYHIPTEDLYSALEKLTKRFSVALLEFTFTKNGGQFVCLCRLAPGAPETLSEPLENDPEALPSTNLDDY